MEIIFENIDITSIETHFWSTFLLNLELLGSHSAGIRSSAKSHDNGNLGYTTEKISRLSNSQLKRSPLNVTVHMMSVLKERVTNLSQDKINLYLFSGCNKH